MQTEKTLRDKQILNFVYVSVKGTSNFDGEMRIGFSTARDLKVDTSMTSLVSKTHVLHLLYGILTYIWLKFVVNV